MKLTVNIFRIGLDDKSNRRKHWKIWSLRDVAPSLLL